MCLFIITAGIFIIVSANHSAMSNFKENWSIAKIVLFVKIV